MFGKNNHQADLEMFTIFDSKTASYEAPSIAINQHDIVRQVVNMFRDPAQARNRFLINAEDYSIFRIGTYDKKTGTIVPTKAPEHVANMHDLRAVAEQAKPDLGIVPT